MLGFIMIFWGGLVVAWRRVWPCARLWEHAYPAGDSLWSPKGVAESPEGDGLYGSPAGRSFYSCASSRAALHIGLLSLCDRQPSNASPLLLSPAGLASRRGPPIPKHAWGCAPRPPNAKLRLDTNWTFQQMLKSRSVRRRRYALKVPAAHFILDLAGTELK